MPVDAVLFDAFGTILHIPPPWREGKREEVLRASLLAAHDAAPGGEAVASTAGRRGPTAGRSTEVRWKRFLPAYEDARMLQRRRDLPQHREFDFAERFHGAFVACGVPTDAARAMGRAAARAYYDAQTGHAVAFDDSPDVLGELAGAFKLGLVSNYADGESLRRALARMGLLKHLDHATVSGDLGLLKPHPRLFLDTCDALGVDPARAVMVGNDEVADVDAAKKAGLRTIWTPYPRPGPGEAAPERASADAVVRRLAEVPAVVRGWD